LKVGDVTEVTRVLAIVKKKRQMKSALKLILVPLNLSEAHWALVAIYLPGQKEMRAVYVDSLPHSKEDAMECIRQVLYLCSLSCDDGGWNGDIEVPNQLDSHSCGDCVISFCKFLMREVIRTNSFPGPTDFKRPDWSPDCSRPHLCFALATKMVAKDPKLASVHSVAQFLG
jgi:Ulp1 family protease